MKLDDALRGVTRLGIDTPLFIYFIEKNPTYLNLVREVVRRVDAGDITGWVSTIVLTEVLPVPIRARDNAVEAKYRSVLLHSRNLTPVPVDFAVAERAAELRATYNLKPRMLFTLVLRSLPDVMPSSQMTQACGASPIFAS